MHWSGIIAVSPQLVSISPKWNADKYISVLQLKIFLSFMHCIFQKPDYGLFSCLDFFLKAAG